MKEIKIANVLVEDSRQFHVAPALYLRTFCNVEPKEGGAWRLCGPGSFDFTTFFNGLAVAKYDRYTVAKEYHLHLELKGAAVRVVQTCADSFDYYARQNESNTATIPESREWTTIDLELSYAKTDVIVGFVIEAEGDVLLRNGYYSAMVEDGAVRPVELALSTTTFKKETFIRHNIELVRNQILASDEPIAHHFKMFVIETDVPWTPRHSRATVSRSIPTETWVALEVLHMACYSPRI